MAEDARRLEEAIALEAEAQAAALAGDGGEAARAFAGAAKSYRASWEAARPRAFGRLIGMLKATVLAGSTGVEDAAAYVAAQVPDPDSPPSWYAVGLAALVLADDRRAAQAAAGMRGEGASDAFGRAADALSALATGDPDTYASAVAAMVADFEGRDEHLTGVPFADTALMFERLAGVRGMRAGVTSKLLPLTDPG